LFPASHASKNPSLQSSPLQKEERRIQRIAETSFSAVLLAGGESRRMGKDKATMSYRGKPLWQIQLELLRQLTPQEIFVSARSDPDWRPADIQFVADDPPSRGPLAGLAASLDRMSTSHLLALAIDMPWMSENFLRSLCDQTLQGCGVLPKIDNRAEPLAAIYPREAKDDFRNALTGADFSLQTLVRHLLGAGKLQEISVPEQAKKLFLNVNTPSDLPML
jgi:molybdopterin-guanine dinucleotide biosynthesis protein A